MGFILTDRLGRQPASAPFAAKGARLDEVQGFVAGTLDTVGRFIANIRSRGSVSVTPPPAEVPIAVTATAAGKMDLNRWLLIGGVALLAFFIFKKLK